MHSRAFFRQWYYGATHTFFFFTAAPSFYWQKAMYKKIVNVILQKTQQLQLQKGKAGAVCTALTVPMMLSP